MSTSKKHMSVESWYRSCAHSLKSEIETKTYLLNYWFCSLTLGKEIDSYNQLVTRKNWSIERHNDYDKWLPEKSINFLK